MRRLRVLVADDEPLAREMVRDLLLADPEVEVVGECGDGERALALIRDERPDVAFLDVEMPERGGLEVAAALAPAELPAVVFVTAYGQYATNAFEVEALDYVVKPFSDDRFRAALERAKRRVRKARLGELAQKVASLAAELGGAEAVAALTAPLEPAPEPAKPPGSEPLVPEHLTRICVKSHGRSLVLKLREVTWIEACDYYARLHTPRGSHLVRTPLATFEERLDPRFFLRVHRRAIVNVDAVVELAHLFKGARAVVLTDGTRLRVSRSCRRRVDEVLAPKVTGG